MNLQDKLEGEAFDSEELKIFTYIQEERPQWTETFLRHLVPARRGILHRFLQAAIRENIAGLAAGAAEDREENRLILRLPAGAVLTAPIRRWHSLGRFDLADGPVVVEGKGGRAELTHPVDLLDLLRDVLVTDERAGERFDRFRQELQNSVANYALALTGADIRKGVLREDAQGAATTLDYARGQSARDLSFSPLSFYEQWVVEGHPLHPGAKIKMGLEVEDVIRHSPEWGAEPLVVPVAVRKEARTYSSLTGQSPSELLYADYRGLKSHVEAALEAQGLDPQDYDLIPVHPWQAEHTLPALYEEALRRKEILPIPTYRLRTAALMSFRSLAPYQQRHEGKHHIKTAVNVQTTGAVRTVAPSAATNGPIISRLLRDVQEREGRFGGSFVILEERVGVYYSPQEGELTESEKFVLGKNLASLLRENPENHVGDEELAMPGSALLADSPLSERPIVGELIEEFAKQQEIAGLHEAAEEFMKRYAEVSLPGFLTTMCRYGVALEGHLQNSVAVFRDGSLVRMILRDFGGVRILRERIAAQGLSAEFYPGAATIIDDVHDMRNKIYYPVFQNHFGELIASIVRWCGIDESRLWAPVASVCRSIFAALKEDQMIAEQTRSDEEALFAKELDLKAMATMRLLGDVTTYTFSQVPNPLSAHCEK